MCNYVPWRKKTPHFISPQVSFAFPDAAVHWCHTLTEILPDLYPLEVRGNPVLLSYRTRDFLPPCLYICYQTQVKDAQMNAWIFRNTSIQAKGIAQYMWEENQALCLCSNISQLCKWTLKRRGRHFKIHPSGYIYGSMWGICIWNNEQIAMPLNQQDCYQVCSWVG